MTRETIRVIGLPWRDGTVDFVCTTGQDYRGKTPKVGDRVTVSPGNPTSGVIVHVQWHDDRVTLTVDGATLEFPAGTHDWKAVLIPDVLTDHLVEETEQYLADPGWWE